MTPAELVRFQEHYRRLPDAKLAELHAEGPVAFAGPEIWALLDEEFKRRAISPHPIQQPQYTGAAHGFGSRDWKLFLRLALIFHLPPLLVLVLAFILSLAPGVGPVVGLLALLPYVFWVNIPAIPLARFGVPYYDFQEFGAVPKGPMGLALIILFWLVVAFVATAVVKHRRARP